MSWKSSLKMMKVAVGIVYNQKEEILIAKRPLDKHLGGFWEFPGGKFEKNESGFMALQRELKEEIGIKLLKATALTQIQFSYPNKDVLLDVWKVEDYLGIPQGLEGQKILWVRAEELKFYQFPEANQEIFKYLKRSETNNVV